MLAQLQLDHDSGTTVKQQAGGSIWQMGRPPPSYSLVTSIAGARSGDGLELRNGTRCDRSNIKSVRELTLPDDD